MMKILRLFLLLIIVSFGIYAEDEKAPPPLEPEYMGSHGMVLMTGSYTMYASNIPTYSKPSNVQLVYKLESKNPPLFYLVRDADLVTIKTKPFNIQRLMRGEEVKVKVDVYMGHFDKGGALMFKDMEIVFQKHLYTRELTKEVLQPSANLHKYDTVKLSGKEKILIHQVQLPPSYDHLILVYQDVNCMTDVIASSAVPAPNEIISRLTTCGSMKPLYYSTDNFK